ncbi:MAG: alkene reductase [Bacteroidales bacterium]|nr:alkene reductase [Bacteroidales bacterium]MCF6342985.1 alkene reductase [Bacteroidales bacterium]
MNNLFTPIQIGGLTLANRIVMAPLTRSRADNAEHKATPLIAEYYRQRASAGLIISEGSQISEMAVGYLNTPGIYSKAQTEAWKQVTEAVHGAGGKIFIQLWHVGRMSHPDFHGGKLPVAPSAINSNGFSNTANGRKPAVTPHALSIPEIKHIVADFKNAAANAMEAGFDGVEIHSSNGYLLHQFFAPCSNVRTDEYGGSIENRCRILFEVLDEMKTVMPENRIGVRLNPSAHDYHGLTITEDTLPTFDYLIDKLNDYNLSYLHLSEPFTDVTNVPFAEPHIARRYRKIYRGNLMINKGFTAESGNKIIAENGADLVAFGVPFIANPDLVKRFELGLPLAEADKTTYYTSGAKGYTDYPAFTAG